MAKLIHLSDLHFGAHDDRLVAAVEARIDESKPDLVVISGDFTQRARTEQFEEACQFLGRLKDSGHEVLGVPGNHDVPLYDVLRRFLSPLTRYRRYIDDSLCPFHELPGAAVLGINTARSLTFKDGRINEDQVAHIQETFSRTSTDAVRILVTHHPLFALPVSDGPELGKPVGRQHLALGAVADAGVDLLLAGHNHRASAHHAKELVTDAGSALVIQAGTATSTRLRDEEQSFNLIELGDGDVTVKVQAWDGSGYASRDTERFVRRAEHWETDKGSNSPRLQRLERNRLLRLRPGKAKGGEMDGAAMDVMDLPQFDLGEFVRRVLAEDLGSGGDVTSKATIDPFARFTAEMNCREPIVIAGIEIAAAFFRTLDREVQIERLAKDGDAVESGSVLRLRGNARAMLAAERSALNTLQHLSGIATMTRRYVDAIAGTGATLLDTRKTIPGLRLLEKYAARMGGAENHRMRMDDGLLIKDNHVGVCGGVAEAVKAARQYDSGLQIQVEVDRLEQIEPALDAGAQRLLLDNMPPETLREAVALVGGRVPLEASGGVRLETIRAIAESGVNYISVGRITQSAPAVDIGLDYVLES